MTTIVDDYVRLINELILSRKLHDHSEEIEDDYIIRLDIIWDAMTQEEVDESERILDQSSQSVVSAKHDLNLIDSNGNFPRKMCQT